MWRILKWWSQRDSNPCLSHVPLFAIYFGQFAYATHPRRSCQKVGKWKLGGDLFGHFYSVYEHGSPVHRRHQLRMFEPAERLFGD
jgi:hypothetical protein